MRTRKLVFMAAILFLQSEQEVRADEQTWIELTSGETLKGTISAVYDSRMYFDSIHFGEIRIQLSKIRKLRGPANFEVTTEELITHQGTLAVNGDTVIVTTADEQLEVSRSQLLSVTPLAQRERDRWTGDVRVGLNVREGNTDIKEGNLAMTLIRRTPTERGIVDYLGQMNETEGERVANSHRLNVSRDRFTGNRLFWRPLAVQYYQDRLQNIAHQGTADAGFGYILADSDRVDWDIQVGAGVNYLRKVSVEDGESRSETSPAGTLGSDLTIEITPSVDFDMDIAMSFLNEESGRYQHHIVNRLSTDLTGNLDFDVSLIWDRTERPQTQEDGTQPEKDDWWMVFGLSYEF